MAALVLYACNTLHLLYDLTQVLVASGFSLSQSYHYLQARRRRYLFREYCLEVWRGYYNTRVANIIVQKSSLRNRKEVPSDVTDTDRVNADIGVIIDADSRSARMLKRGAGIDFAAIEATAESYENEIRSQQEEATRIQSELQEHLENIDDIEVINGTEFNSTFYDYVETRPVYRNKNIGPLQEGVSLTVTGYMILTCERFSINLILNNERRDVALHINPRLPHNYIVRNTKVKEVWGDEEVTSPLPFSLKRGSKFSIQILVTDACYMISVNGHHFAEYSHRLPYKSVDCIEVKGDVEHVNFERSVVRSYPDRLPESQAKDIPLVDTLSEADEEGSNIPAEFKLIPRQGRSPVNSANNEVDQMGLTLPYYGRLPPKTLTAGRCLKIEGRVKVLPHSFYVNLQRGQDIWPHALIAFHFNPRFSKQGGCLGKHIVCRNAWYNGKWAEEERSELDTDFRPGKTFSLLIVAGAQAYEVYVNRKLITRFTYCIEPEIVDTIYIQGDIKLWSVLLVKKVSEGRIYENPAYNAECD